MAIHLGMFLRRLRQRLYPSLADSDAALLDRFARQHDEEAFATVLGRYGPLVLGVCRQILYQEQDVEDAFQATFLVLAHKAGGIHAGKPLAAWLHGVACRVAQEARRRNARRHHHEQRGAVMHGQTELADLEQQELGLLLHEELQRLPDKYRQPLILCYLDGQTHEAAADLLGWPVGTVRTRLSRGRELLHRRLARRGVALSTAAVASLLAQAGAKAAVPPALAAATVKAAVLVAAGELATAGLSAGVLSLVQGVLRTMLLSKCKVLGMVVVMLALGGLGLAVVWPTAQTTQAAPAVVDPAQVEADLPAVVKGNTQFAFDLYARLRQDPTNQSKNLFLSPYSISTALAMTSAGARNDTLTQMEKTLRFPVEQARLHAAFGALQQKTRSGKGYQLNIANALWCQRDVPFHDEFLTLNETHYGAKPDGVDFISNTEQARQTINRWVEKQTQDRIKELLKPGAVTPLTRLVLTNAIYFKGDWATKFDKKLTKDEPFVRADQSKVNVPMMHQGGEFPYFKEAGLQVVELPYAGKELSMVIFLPEKVDGLAEFEQSLTAEKLQQLLGKLQPIRLADVALPRFKLESEFLLNEVLQTLGMLHAFEMGRADFSGIALVAQSHGWHISAVVHKGFLDINEEGTEAAAATAVRVEAWSASPPPPSFRADHPFFFVIRDKRTDSILFMGRVIDPSGQS